MSVPIHISIRGVQGFPFLCILPHTYTFYAIAIPTGVCCLIVISDSHFPDDEGCQAPFPAPVGYLYAL